MSQLGAAHRQPGLLFLCEGNPENPSKSGSGTPTSVIEHLRARGSAVVSADVDLVGAQRALGATLTYTRDREAWRARYHLAPVVLRLRSRNATAALRRRRSEVDAVLQYGGTFGVGPDADIPYFLFCDNNIINSGRQPRSWAAQMPPAELAGAIAWERALYRGAAGIFTFSEYIRRSFLADYATAESRVVAVGSGPNLSLDRIPTERAFQGPGHSPTVLFVGRDFEHKGGPVLLEAFRMVRREIPNARLILVGPKTLDVAEPGVEFLGYLRKDVPDEYARLVRAYAEADVFCLPTRYESFGIAFLEAMWFGLPVVGPAHWAIPEMVEDGVTGRLAQREDPGTYAEYLLELLRDAPRAREMGRLGRARAESRFSWAQVTAVMSDVIADVLARRGESRA